jgi:uncharacterized protein (DUF2236 family)
MNLSAPVSLSRRLNGERITLLAWPRAILMQLAHPLVAEGVYEHSSFGAGPLAAAQRLRATVRAMLSLTFGDATESETALERIRSIHRRVHGQLGQAVGPFRAGTPYSAEDPDLVLWVHVTLLDSIPSVFDLVVSPLSDAERNAYCEQAAAVAVALGARAQEVPRSWPEAQAYTQRILASGTIAVGPHARELAREVTVPSALRMVPPLGWSHRLITIGLLPPALRTAYGYHWDDVQQRRFDALVHVVRRARRCMPRPVALWPEARGRR